MAGRLPHTGLGGQVFNNNKIPPSWNPSLRDALNDATSVLDAWKEDDNLEASDCTYSAVESLIKLNHMLIEELHKLHSDINYLNMEMRHLKSQTLGFIQHRPSSPIVMTSPTIPKLYTVDNNLGNPPVLTNSILGGTSTLGGPGFVDYPDMVAQELLQSKSK